MAANNGLVTYLFNDWLETPHALTANTLDVIGMSEREVVDLEKTGGYRTKGELAPAVKIYNNLVTGLPIVAPNLSFEDVANTLTQHGNVGVIDFRPTQRTNKAAKLKP